MWWRTAAFAALSALLFGAGAAAAESGGPVALSACVDENEFPPYSYNLRRDGVRTEQLAGYSVDYVASIARLSGVPIRLSMLPWARCLWMVENGAADFAIDVINAPERAERYTLVGPYYRINGVGFLYRKRFTGPLPRSAVEFSSHSICVPLGYTFYGLGVRENKRVARPATYGQAYKMLRAGRCDMIPVLLAMLHAARTLGIDDPRLDGDLAFQAADWVRDIEMYLAVGKASPQHASVVAFLEYWTRQMYQRGETARLMRAHGMG